MSFINRIHSEQVHHQRVRVLSDHLAELIPQNARVLDIGCGDGLLAYLIKQKRPDVEIKGIDILVRSQTHISVDEFDGQVIPYADANFDAVTFVDVLHHLEDPMILLREAVRVTREAILIKDHTCNGLFASPTLRFMDWVGNAHHNVALPYNYWSQRKWLEVFDSLDLMISVWRRELGLYARPANWIFGRSLHFVARLDLEAKSLKSQSSTAGLSLRDEGSESDSVRTIQSNAFGEFFGNSTIVRDTHDNPVRRVMLQWLSQQWLS